MSVLLVSILNLFTILNKIVLALLLFFKKNNSQPNKFLALIVLLPAFTVLSNYLLFIKDYRFDFMIFVNQISIHFMSPSIYLYCLLLMGKKIQINYKLFLYFITALLPVACWIVYETYSPEAKNLLLEHAFSNPDILLQIMNLGIEIQFVFFMCLSLYKIRKHNKKIKDIYSEYDKTKVKWLNKFIILMLLLALTIGGSHILFSAFTMELIILPILSNVFYFYIVYQSFNNSVLFTHREFSDFQKLLEPASLENPEKYKYSSLGDVELKEQAELIGTLIESKKMYLDPDLNLSSLSSKSGISSHRISEVINRHFNQSFFDYINVYRIAFAKEKLSDPRMNNFTLEAIGEISGFGSKSAFNRAFKKNTGTTPSQYRKGLTCIEIS